MENFHSDSDNIATLQPAQDGEWQSVADYFDEKAPMDVKKKVKTAAAKRNWVTKALLGERVFV